MAAKREPYLSPEDYLAIEREAQHKSEYFSGQMWAMAGASREHNLIVANISGEVRARLKGRPCETYSNDLRVRVTPAGLYTYPDVVVVCGQPEFVDLKGDTLLNPTVLVEVLSPGTEAWDRGGKWAQFQRLPSLQEYVLVSQDAMIVEQFTRQAGGTWLYSRAEGPDAALFIASVNVTVPLPDVYDRIVFDAE